MNHQVRHLVQKLPTHRAVGLPADSENPSPAFFQSQFWRAPSILEAAAKQPWYWTLIIPALGGLIIAPLIYYGAQEAKVHGVPEIMDALILRGGRIRAKVAAVKALASSICIGSGGSAGRFAGDAKGAYPFMEMGAFDAQQARGC